MRSEKSYFFSDPWSWLETLLRKIMFLYRNSKWTTHSFLSSVQSSALKFYLLFSFFIVTAVVTPKLFPFQLNKTKISISGFISVFSSKTSNFLSNNEIRLMVVTAKKSAFLKSFFDTWRPSVPNLIKKSISRTDSLFSLSRNIE